MIVVGANDLARSVPPARAAASLASEVTDLGRPVPAGDPAMFSADRFHPSSAGYAAIAAALTSAVVSVARSRRDAAAA